MNGWSWIYKHFINPFTSKSIDEYLIWWTLLWIFVFFFFFFFISNKKIFSSFGNLCFFTLKQKNKKCMCPTKLSLLVVTNNTAGYEKENEEIGLGFVYIPKFKIQKNKLKPKQTKKPNFQCQRVLERGYRRLIPKRNMK